MPRIYDSANNPLDFCKPHFPSETVAEAKYGDVTKTGEGPDGRGNCFTYEADHPDYDGLGYRCETCKRTLTNASN